MKWYIVFLQTFLIFRSILHDYFNVKISFALLIDSFIIITLLPKLSITSLMTHLHVYFYLTI